MGQMATCKFKWVTRSHEFADNYCKLCRSHQHCKVLVSLCSLLQLFAAHNITAHGFILIGIRSEQAEQLN